jgi:magnesium chelatase family protein
MLAKIYGSALYGVDAFRVTVEVSVSNGINYQITGLPDDAIKESLSRIAIVINSNGFHMPRNKLVINLSPADVRKTGTAFDLPIAIGIMLANEELHDINKLKDYLLVGELGLDGSILPVRGALCMAHLARKEGLKGIILPAANAKEASLVTGIDVFSVKHIREVVEFVQSDCSMEPVKGEYRLLFPAEKNLPDFKDVSGQQYVKRAMEIAAAGGHNALLIGPPGTGKTMLAKRLPSILPPMTIDEALETTRIYSVTNIATPLSGLITIRPFRNPHHTASDVALVGGGSSPVPGEISLAHNGVLFLDELAEFKRTTIEALRQPLEERKVFISRAKMTVEFPASFMFIAAMNPCFCGYHGHPERKCTCSKRALYYYRRKISGPLLERIDLHIVVDPVPLQDLMENKDPGESSSQIRKRVIAARKIQLQRFSDTKNIYCNALMKDEDISKYCWAEDAARKYLWQKMQELQLSARSYSRILKIARTIADLAGSGQIELVHIAEAIHFRCLDKPIVTESKKEKRISVAGFPFSVRYNGNGQV